MVLGTFLHKQPLSEIEGSGAGYAFSNTERAPDFLRMTIELGAACCLRKPFTPKALLTTVNECLTKQVQSARHSK